MIDQYVKECILRYISSQGKDFRPAELAFAEPDSGEDGKLFSCPHVMGIALPTIGMELSLRSGIPDALKKLLRFRDESFTEALLRLIKERGMTNAECYRRAHIDRKLFCKIQKDVHYRPAKKTALAFAIALELDEEEAREFLAKAGYALSKSDTFDLVLEYCIRSNIYDVMLINEYLLEFDLPLLGA